MDFHEAFSRFVIQNTKIGHKLGKITGFEISSFKFHNDKAI